MGEFVRIFSEFLPVSAHFLPFLLPKIFFKKKFLQNHPNPSFLLGKNIPAKAGEIATFWIYLFKGKEKAADLYLLYPYIKGTPSTKLKLM